MTTFEEIQATCGVCGAISAQQAIASTSRFGAPDLDLRPPELERSTLAWRCARCPVCGYVAGADLGLPAGAAAEAVRATIDGQPYKAASADGGLPQHARDACCRALVADAVGDEPAAAQYRLWAAWACDDSGAAAAAARLRLEAVERIRRLRAGRKSLFQEDGVIADRIVLADLLRRAGRHRAALEEVSAAFGVDAPPELVRILQFQADLAWRGDEQAHTLDEAPEVPLGRDATSRRVPCGAVDADAATPITAVDCGRDDERVELRRGEAGSAWYSIGAGEMRQISAWEAALAVATPQGRALWDVLDATAAELEWWAIDTGWRAAVNVEYSRTEEALQGLYDEWNLSWLRQAQIDNADAPGVIDPMQLPGRLAEAENAGFADVRVVVRGRPDDERAYARVIDQVLSHVVERRPRGSIAVLSGEGGYVQVIASRGRTTVYLEAVDRDHQGAGTLTQPQRDLLAAFGWHDPKLEPIPYHAAQYAGYWSGGNLVQEIDRTLLDVIAGTLSVTLTRVYGLKAGDDLRVSIFDHHGG